MVKDKMLRRLRLRLLVAAGGGTLSNHRKCGCVDYTPKNAKSPGPGWGRPFILICCDSCGGWFDQVAAVYAKREEEKRVAEAEANAKALGG